MKKILIVEDGPGVIKVFKTIFNLGRLYLK